MSTPAQQWGLANKQYRFSALLQPLDSNDLEGKGHVSGLRDLYVRECTSLREPSLGPHCSRLVPTNNFQEYFLEILGRTWLTLELHLNSSPESLIY